MLCTYFVIYEKHNFRMHHLIFLQTSSKRKMGALMISLFLGAMGALATKEHCESEQYTQSGECCLECPPGEGMLKRCGATQTICTPCLDSETFSDTYSLTDTCQPCTQCEGLMRMLTPCTDSNNAVCVCTYGFYLSEVSGSCEPCTTCPPGYGVLVRCDHGSDTICEECVDDTFSDSDSALDPCLPCTICEVGQELELAVCTMVSDTICHDPSFVSASPATSLDFGYPFTEIDLPGDSESPSPTDSATTANPRSSRFDSYGLKENLIPIYCSILAAVVLGLVAYIIFKRWNSCKQNKQAAGNRAANQTALPEGEKLHSDSGISVDSQSLQEQQQAQAQPAQTPTQTLAETVVMMDGGPGLALPAHKGDELERLLGGAGGRDGLDDEADWRSLAGLLGYQEEHIDVFGQEERPVRALLSHWAGKDSASVEALCAALRKMDRADVVQSLGPYSYVDPSATSAV